MTPAKSLAHIAGDLRTQGCTAVKMMETVLERHARSEPTLMAYRHWAGPRAMQQAEHLDGLIATGADFGPLMGIPVSVKDLYGVPGLPVCAGTDAPMPEAWQAPGPVVKAVMAQMGLVTGKTHTVEFAFGGIGTNPHTDTPVNPWSAADAPRAPGGSSSGAGVSLAQGTALLALGTDTAGSVRIPASFTGQSALKVTHGRWSIDGIVPLSPSLDTPGILARSVADLAYGFAALDGGTAAPIRPAGVAGLRLGVIRNTVWEGVEESIAENTTAALRRIERAGAGLADVDLAHCEDALDIFRNGGLAAPELRAFLDRSFPERIARLDPKVAARVESADGISASDYLQRVANLRHYGQVAAGAFDQFDLLVSPTVAITAPLLSELSDPEAYRVANIGSLRNTALVNLFGWCALTVPTGLDTYGIPSGLQLIAPPMQEARLLSMALAIEETIGSGPEVLGSAPLV